VLVPYRLSTQSSPKLRHLSHRGTSFSIPCWYQSVPCVTSHRVTSAPTLRWSLNLRTPIFCSSAGQQMTIARRQIRALCGMSQGSLCIKIRHVNLFSWLPSYFWALQTLLWDDQWSKAPPLKYHLHLGRGWSTSKHNCLLSYFIMLTTTCFGHCGPSSGHKNVYRGKLYRVWL